MTRAIVVCETCRYADDQKTGPDGRTGGEQMIAVLRSRAAERADNVTIVTQQCLWACSRHCNVLLQDSERYSYLAGDFRPTDEHADAILDWFTAHGETETGEVPFRLWPDTMRGHFIARIPVAPGKETSS